MEYYIIISSLLLILFLLTLKKRKKLNKKDYEFIISKWIGIENMLHKNSNYNQAVIEADKLFDFILSQKGYIGHLGDKLKKYKSKYINDIWYAHKLRNKIAHELGYNINKEDAYRAIYIFKKAIQESGINIIK